MERKEEERARKEEEERQRLEKREETRRKREEECENEARERRERKEQMSLTMATLQLKLLSSFAGSLPGYSLEEMYYN